MCKYAPITTADISRLVFHTALSLLLPRWPPHDFALDFEQKATAGHQPPAGSIAVLQFTHPFCIIQPQNTLFFFFFFNMEIAMHLKKASLHRQAQHRSNTNFPVVQQSNTFCLNKALPHRRAHPPTSKHAAGLSVNETSFGTSITGS